MKRLKLFFFVGMLALVSAGLLSCALFTPSQATQQTVVYVVRHAEKAPSSGAMTDDPELSAAGQKRAGELKTKLAKEPVAGLFATKYKRTQLTLQPLAQAKKQTVQVYNAGNAAQLAQNISQNFIGKTVVVAGHSNTVLSIIEALGAKKPLEKVEDHQYDYLFKVTLQQGKEPQVEVSTYGDASVAPAK